MILLLRRIIKKYRNRNDGQTYMRDGMFCITVTNTSNSPKTCVLFGNNNYLMSTNYGSENGIQISGKDSYLKMLMQSANQPFQTSLVRLKSIDSKFPDMISIQSSDANGRCCASCIEVKLPHNAYNLSTTIIDVPFEAKIDGNTHLSFVIEANATISISVYLKEKKQYSGGLKGYGTTTNIGVSQVGISNFGTTINISPLKFISGTNLYTPENDTVEYNGTDFYYTKDGSRKKLLLHNR